MSDELISLKQQAAVQRIMRRLDAFACGLELDEAMMLQITEYVVVDMPAQSDDARLDAARKWMVSAASA